MSRIKIILSDEQKEILRQEFRTTNDRGCRNRCQAILLLARGDTQQEVADALGVQPRCLRSWRERWQRFGVEGLRTRKAPGRERKIPPELTDKIMGWVRGGPESLGLERGNWTHAELAHQLYITHGIKVDASTMRRFCHRHSIRPYRPSYRFLRADTQAQQRAATELVALKK